MTPSASPLITRPCGIQFLLLIIAALGAAYARVALSPLQETMRSDLLLSDNQLALLQGPAIALPMFAAAIPIGFLIDRYSRARILLIFAALDLAGGVLTAVAPNFLVLFTARCLVGIAVATVTTTVFSLLSDLYAPAQRGRASTVVCIGQYMGLAAAFAFGGQLIGMSGGEPDGWRQAMLWLNVPLLLVMILMLVTRELPRTETLVQAPSVRESLHELWGYRALIAPLIFGLIMADIAVFGVLAWAAPTLERTYGLGPDRVGTIISTATIVSGVLGPIAGGVLADVCQRTGGPRWTVTALAGIAALSVPAGLFAVMPDVTLAAVCMAMFMTAGGAILVVGITLFTIVIPNELRGVCLSVSAGAQFLLGIGVAPLAVSLLSGAMGGGAMIGKALTIVCVAVSLLGAATFVFGIRYFPRLAMR